MLDEFFPGLDVRPGQVIDATDSLERRGEAGVLGQVAHDDLDPRAFQVGGQPAGVADQHPDGMSPVEQLPGQLPADEAGGPQDQDLGRHSVPAVAVPLAAAHRGLADGDGWVAWMPATIRPISTQVRTTSRPSSGERRGSSESAGLA